MMLQPCNEQNSCSEQKCIVSVSRVLISQIAVTVQIITLEDAMRTYAQGKWKYGKSYLQKVREYSKTYIVTIQEKISLFTS